jgi:hypothetical protein
MSVTVFVSTFPGLSPLRLTKSSDTKISDLISEIHYNLPQNVVKSSYLSLKSGKSLSTSQTLNELVLDDSSFVELRLNACLCGGKGGFGSMLKAQGTKMSRKKNKNTKEYTDSLRTVDGVRMKTIRQAKELHDHLEATPSREKESVEKKKAKLKAIIAGASQTSKSTKFRDEEFLEQSEQLLTEVRGAVKLSAKTAQSNSSRLSESPQESDSERSDNPSSSSLGTSVESNNLMSVKCKPKGMGFFGGDDSEDDL